jgi:effector-binding domain-containing protein
MTPALTAGRLVGGRREQAEVHMTHGAFTIELTEPRPAAVVRGHVAHDGTFDIAVGFPVTSPVSPSDGVVPMRLPGGTVARTTVTGPYAEIGAAYDALIAWIDESGYELTGDFLERYLDGPNAPSPRTVIEVPCRMA